jgi:hypothetical protein
MPCSNWPWLRFFTCEQKEEYEMLAKRHPELEEAVVCTKRMSLSESWRDYWFHRNLWKVDERNLHEQIRIDAHAEGHSHVTLSHRHAHPPTAFAKAKAQF